MPGDILKKRKIAVLGSRSVGEAHTSHLVLFLRSVQLSLLLQESHPSSYNSLRTSSSTLTILPSRTPLLRVSTTRALTMTVTLSIPLARSVYTASVPHLISYHEVKDEYSILNSKHAIGIHGFVLVYSVTSRNSFDMIQIVYDKIINFCGIKEIPCVIVGSKIDLSQR